MFEPTFYVFLRNIFSEWKKKKKPGEYNEIWVH